MSCPPKEIGKLRYVDPISAVGAGDAAASPRNFWGAKFGQNLGKILARVIKIGQIYLDLEKIKTLHPQKHLLHPQKHLNLLRLWFRS